MVKGHMYIMLPARVHSDVDGSVLAMNGPNIMLCFIFLINNLLLNKLYSLNKLMYI